MACIADRNGELMLTAIKGMGNGRAAAPMRRCADFTLIYRH
jgi:hypothetical protein